MDALKILMVDDEARMRKLVKDFLTNKGFSVVEAGSDSLFTNPFFSINWIRFVTVDLPTANLCSISF